MSLKTEEERDQQLNPGERHARQLNEREQSAFDDIASNYNQDADDSQENANIDRAKNQEENPRALANPMNYTPGSKSKIKGAKGSGSFKRRGPITALILAIVGGGIASIVPFMATIMPIDITERFTAKNDSSSPAMERRGAKVVGNMVNDGNTVCGSSRITIKCRMGRVSNFALHQLSKKGVVAVGYDGSRVGYPSGGNPAAYEFRDSNGRTRTVQASEMRSFLADPQNKKWASQVLGKRGAFNLRAQAWLGKHINSKLFSKFGIRKNGGIADGNNRRMAAAERFREARAKLARSIPGADRMAGITDRVRQKVRNHTGKAQRGGTAYLVLAAGCIVPKIPTIIAATVAMVHLKELIPIINNTVLSPGSKAKASGVDTEHSVTSEDMEMVGTLLTNQTPRESDGKMTSAMDSPYLLAALGVNTNRLPTSNHVPGFAAINNPATRAGLDIQEATQGPCSVILSPTTMWSMAAADAVVTTFAASTIALGLVKVVLSWATSMAIISWVTDQAVSRAEDYAQSVVDDFNIEEAGGEEFGDILGISAMTFFSSAGMSRHLPALSEDEVAAFNQVKQEVAVANRDMELANVHPLDPSSQYTITGSILHNIHTASLKNGTYGTPMGILSGIASLPMTVMSNLTTVGATQDEAYCSYANRFGLDTGNPSTTPAINASGMPCTGINGTQANMETVEAVDLLVDEGWIDEDATENLPDDATIGDLVEANVIVEDTPLREFIDTCSNPDTGDYLFDSPGCITRSLAGGGSIDVEDCNDERCIADIEGSDANVDLNIDNPRSIQAIPVFLLDYQMVQSINGEDIYDGSESASPTDETEVIPVDGEWTAPMTPGSYTITSRWRTAARPTHNGVDLAAPMDTPIYAASGGVVSFVGMKSWGTYYITIDHGGGIETEYGHSYPDQVHVTQGETVQAGQLIAGVGNQGNIITGRGTPTRANGFGAHLHFNYLVNGQDFDPEVRLREDHGITL